MNTSEYIVKKLEELGITKFFGVPGDYNFNILYAIENNKNTDWIGCTNELNAGYASDGYARINGYGALVTTYGVGELSAMNAIAGSMAENVPVINIVGMPSTKNIDNRTLIHHNLQDADYFRFIEAFKSVTASTAILTADNAKIEIDRILKVLVKEKKPVYIAIPEDIAVMELIDRASNYNWLSDEESLSKASEDIVNLINNSKKPIIIGDILIKRFNAELEYKNFCEKSNIPVTNFVMGMNLVDQDSDNYLGTYFSDFKNQQIKEYIEKSDCIISIGTICSDLNSFGYNNSQEIRYNIAIYGTYTYINGKRYDDIKMQDILKKITPLINKREDNIEKCEIGYEYKEPQNSTITSEFLYPRIQEYLKDNDILFTETGSIHYGIAQIKPPKNTNIQFQILWGSIGWATPAILGASAAKPDSRVVLITGDGAHLMSALEIGTIIKNGFKPIIIVINNNGYAVERLLCKTPETKFNDVINLNFAKFLRAFEGDIWATKVSTEEDFDRALKVTKIMDKLCYIDVQLDKNDIPELLKNLISGNKEINNVEKNITNSDENITLTNKAASAGYETTVHQAFKDIDKLFGVN